MQIRKAASPTPARPSATAHQRSPRPLPRTPSPAATARRAAYNLSRIPIHPPAPPPLRKKMAVSRPGDAFEQEADRLSGQVMRMPEPQPQSSSPARAASGSARLQQVEALVPDLLHSPGHPLDPATRAFMEPRFGADFSHVRLHTDALAAASARASGAHAYTAGSNIVFARGQYAPHSNDGRRLLAHELAHVTQQRSAAAGPPILMRQPDGQTIPDSQTIEDRKPEDQKVVGYQHPYRVEGTPFTIIPLEPAQGDDEAIHLFGYCLPFRAVRVTNENQVTPLPRLPLRWKDASHIVNEFHIDPNARPNLEAHGHGGAAEVLKHVPEQIDVDPAPPGQPPSAVPRFAITVRSDGFGLDVLDKVLLSLTPDVVPGTPLNGKLDEDNLRRDKVIDPSVHIGFGARGRAYAHATLSMRDPYPAHGIDPTEVSIDATSVPLGSIKPKEQDGLIDLGDVGSVRVNALGVAGARGEVQLFIEEKRISAALARLGLNDNQTAALTHDISAVLVGNFTERFKNLSLENAIDAIQTVEANGSLLAPLKQAIQRYAASGVDTVAIERAAREVLAEVLHPGFAVQGPIYIGAPIGYGYFRAETTRSTRKPFVGSAIGTPFPATLATAGPTIIPAGVLSGTASPALGGVVARDFQDIALSASIAARPYLDPGAGGLAGVATARIGFHVKGVDVVIEGGFRGQQQVVGKAADGTSTVASTYVDLRQAEQNAVRDREENVSKDERGEFAPDLKPDEIIGDPHYNEFYGTVRLVKKF